MPFFFAPHPTVPRSAKTQHDAELNRLYALAEADPMDPEVQRKIEELIQQKNIQESYENAMEHAPEVRQWLAVVRTREVLDSGVCKSG